MFTAKVSRNAATHPQPSARRARQRHARAGAVAQQPACAERLMGPAASAGRRVVGGAESRRCPSVRTEYAAFGTWARRSWQRLEHAVAAASAVATFAGAPPGYGVQDVTLSTSLTPRSASEARQSYKASPIVSTAGGRAEVDKPVLLRDLDECCLLEQRCRCCRPPIGCILRRS